jgi:hypothetical protein
MKTHKTAPAAIDDALRVILDTVLPVSLSIDTTPVGKFCELEVLVQGSLHSMEVYEISSRIDKTKVKVTFDVYINADNNYVQFPNDSVITSIRVYLEPKDC